jgi:hypothetical protein
MLGDSFGIDCVAAFTGSFDQVIKQRGPISVEYGGFAGTWRVLFQPGAGIPLGDYLCVFANNCGALVATGFCVDGDVTHKFPFVQVNGVNADILAFGFSFQRIR